MAGAAVVRAGSGQCQSFVPRRSRGRNALGKARRVAVVLDASRGNGSHQALYFGSAFTIVRNPKDELKTGTFHAMCSQLGIKPGDL